MPGTDHDYQEILHIACLLKKRPVCYTSPVLHVIQEKMLRFSLDLNDSDYSYLEIIQVTWWLSRRPASYNLHKLSCYRSIFNNTQIMSNTINEL